MKPNHRLATLGLRPNTQFRRIDRALLVACAVLGSGGAVDAIAQSETSHADASVLQEITVTATRREASIDTVPIAITALPQTLMDEQGIKTIDDVSRVTPGLSFAPSKAGYINNIAIRGVLSDVGASTTGIYIDETPIQVRSKGVVTESSFPQIFDLERVEILKGPQGTLFGTGSMGGTVRFITPQPSLDKYSGYARAEGGWTKNGDPSYEAGVAVGGPIIADSLGFRASAFYQNTGGYINAKPFDGTGVTDKGINSSTTTVVRAAMKWAATDSVNITPAIYYQNRRRDNDGYFWNTLSNPDSADFNTGYTERSPSHDQFVLPSLKIEWKFANVELVSNTSFFHRELSRSEDYSNFLWNALVGDGSPTPTDPLANYRASSLFNVRQNSFVQEIRLQSTDADQALQWVVGGLVQNSRLYTDQYVVDPLLPALSQNVYGVPLEDAFGEGLLEGNYSYAIHQWAKDKQVAVFGQADYAFSTHWKATLGARLARNSLDYNRDEDGALTASAQFITTRGSAPKTTPFTPKIGVSYESDGHSLYYVSAAKGTREGGVNNPSTASGRPGCPAGVNAPLAYGSDNLWSYELGAKNHWLDGRLRTDASVYYIDWKNIQQNVNNNGCLTTSYTDNLGTATVKGVEFQAELQVLDNWQLTMTGGYSDAKYSSDAFGSPESGTGIRPIIASDGDSLGVAPWNVSLSSRVEFNAFDHKSYFRLDYSYTAKNTDATPSANPRNDTVYDPENRIDPAIRLLGARLGTQIADLDVSLFAKNLLNYTPALGQYHDALGDPLFYGLTLQPWTIGLTVSYKF